MYYSPHYVSARIAAVVSTIVSVVLFCVQTNVWRSLAGPRATALMTSWLQWIGTSHHTSTIMMVYNYLHLHWQAAATDNNAEMSLTAVEYISMSSRLPNSSHVSTWPLYTPWPSTLTWAGEAQTTATSGTMGNIFTVGLNEALYVSGDDSAGKGGAVIMQIVEVVDKRECQHL